MIKQSTSSTSALIDNIYEVYGTTTNNKISSGSTSTFSPFETDNIEELKAKVLELDKEFGS